MRTVIVAATAVLLAACGGAPPGTAAVVRDSAGITIIEYAEAAAPPETWLADSAPVAVVGGPGAPDSVLLSRVIGAAFLPGNGLVVADAVNRELLLVDSTGAIRRRVGRDGDGPGEFRWLSWVGVAGGTITTYVIADRRISRFALSGDFHSLTTLMLPAAVVEGAFDDERLLVRHRVGLPEDFRLAPSGLVRDSVEILVAAADGSTAMPVVRSAGTEELRAIGTVVATDSAPFGRRTVVAAADTFFYLGTQDRFEIQAWSRNGRLLRVIRQAGEPRPVAAADADRWRAGRTAFRERIRGRPVRPEVTTLASYDVVPDRYPAFGRLVSDRAGNLWVEDYRPFPGADTVSTWTVFDPAGSLLARATLPPGQLADLAWDRVALIRANEDGVPRVEVHRIIRQPAH